MHREAMIDLLVFDCLERSVTARGGIWLMTLLRDGFVGFANMDDGRLATEFARRGLPGIDEPPGTDDDAGDALDDHPSHLPSRGDTRLGDEHER
jgi:hypothetical protein